MVTMMLILVLEIHVQLHILRRNFMAVMRVPVEGRRRIFVMVWLSRMLLVVVVAIKLTAFLVFTRLVVLSSCITMMSVALICMESMVNSMFMEVNWLNIMLIIVSMIKFVMFLNLCTVVVHHLVLIVTMVVDMVILHLMHNSVVMMGIVLITFVMMSSSASNRETKVLLKMNWLDMLNLNMLVSVMAASVVRSLVVMDHFMRIMVM